MRYFWPDPGFETLDRFRRRNEFRTFKDIFDPEGLFADLATARERYLRVLADLALLDDQNLWLPLGPSTMVNGQAAGNPRVAGRVRDLKVHPAGSRAYAGSANGGVWYTDDAGQSWLPLGSWAMRPTPAGADRVQSLTIGALDVHFGQNGDGTDNPDLDVVYVATGELRPQSQAAPGGQQGGIGIMRLDGTVTAALASPGGVPWKREGTALSGSGIYRLTHDPTAALSFDPAGSNTLVAAASSGLVFRTGPFVENAAWTRVSAAPFDFAADSATYCSDAIWTPATTAPAAPSRLFVAITDPGGSRTGVHVSSGGPTGAFQAVALPGVSSSSRLGLAFAPSAPQIVYVLGREAGQRARVWRIEESLTARVVSGVPPGLFGHPSAAADGTITVTGDQSHYDLAIQVDPADANVIVVAGSLVKAGGDWNASVHRLTVSGTFAANDFATDFSAANAAKAAADATFIGLGVHPDVHAVAITTPGIWIGCDGGVFAQSAGAMRARNDGLAVAEPGFVASHPADPGPVVAGTQDNGRIRRVGDTVWELWRKGDGGGVAFHQALPAHYVGQYTSATWVANAGAFTTPVFRTVVPPGGNPPDSETNEDNAAGFYSGVAAIAGSGNNTRLAIGTNRVWLSQNWNPSTGAAAMSWVTLPTGSDPRTAPLNDEQDKLSAYDNAESVETLKWARPGDPAKGFDGARLLVLASQTIRQFTFDQASGKWTPKNFTDEKKKNRLTDPRNIPVGASDRLPRIGRWTDIAPHDPGRGAHGSFYVGATGKSKVTATGAVDEATRMDTLWWFDGDDRWHPTNLRNQVMDPATGTSGSKAPVYAVICDPDQPNDVYVGNSMGVWKGTIAFSGTTPTWTWRGLIHGLPQAVVQDLSIHRSGDVKLLRAALQARGVWELDIGASPRSVGRTYLRATNLDTRRAELPAAPSDPLSTSSPPDVFALTDSPDMHLHAAVGDPPWGTGLPTEADLFTATEDVRRQLSRARVTPGTYPVFVMAHHRHTDRLAAGGVRILLIHLADAPDDLSTVATGTAFAQAAVGLFGSGTALPAGWTITDAAQPIRSPAQPIEARTPRAVRFEASLSHAFTPPATLDGVLLLAIVSSTTDPVTRAALDEPSLDLLVRRCRHVALRRILRTA